MKIIIRLQSNFLKALEIIGKIFTGGQFFQQFPLYPFLKSGVVFVFAEMDGNLQVLMYSLKNLRI